jgi:SAM-dependent methyltransferase
VALDGDYTGTADESFAARLDESLAPRGPEVLLQVVRELGLPPDSLVADVGCGSGHHAFRLAMHFGFRILGFDPVQTNLDRARAARRDQPEQVAGRVSFERGSATALPVRDRSVDLVWCRDVLPRVTDGHRALAEFARVLRPGGHVVAHQVVATADLSPREAAGLCAALGLDEGSLQGWALDDAIDQSRLERVATLDLSSEWAEQAEEESGVVSRALVHLARLQREPGRYRAEFGDDAYELMVARCRWMVLRMSGALAGRLDVLRAP